MRQGDAKPVRAALRMRRSGIRGRGAGRFAAAHADGETLRSLNLPRAIDVDWSSAPTRPLRPLRRG